MPPPSISAAAAASGVCRTAIDALQAKYSAIGLAGYYSPVGVVVPGPSSCLNSEEEENEDDDTCANAAPATGSYPALLESMLTHIMSGHSSSSSAAAKRRQTPLVNVGYAVRVACLLETVQRFIHFHQHQQAATRSSIQIVILGAGLDVTGLWALLSSSSSSSRIRVVEVDLPEICEAKKQAILQNLNHLHLRGQHRRWLLLHHHHPQQQRQFSSLRELFGKAAAAALQTTTSLPTTTAAAAARTLW